jgi:pyruvate dehydrogenase E2 component (dihydrolipoamide acetyltransferase)
VPATPYVKNMAKSLGVDLRLAAGTGNAGRVTEGDVLRAAPPAAPLRSAGPQAAPRPGASFIEMTEVKRVTGQRMGASFRDTPHIYFNAKIDMTNLQRHRRKLLDETGHDITYSDFFLCAAARALEALPAGNASFRDGRLLENPDVNIGFAVATPRGLMAPVVAQAQRRTLLELAARRKELVRLALDGKLSIGDMEGGTFTVTNLGVYGIDAFLPIINPPEAAILSIGSMRDEVMVQDRAMRVCPVVEVWLAADHRVLDGADSAALLSDIKRRLLCEKPLL